jgi:16S rRNA (cytosine1402-N4)-methyltransferase
MIYHVPVLTREVIAGLSIQPTKWYIDATVGGGGYSVDILARGGNVLGIDTDTEAISFTKERLLREFPNHLEHTNWKLVHDNFRNIRSIVQREGIVSVSGILFDLGFSSHQIDTGERGMSFRFLDQPFDLRLNQQEGEPASELINRVTKEELYEILAKYGEEERAQSIAHYLYHARSVKRIETVGDVVSIIEKMSASPEKERVLARVFQAFRIVVNDELGALKEGLAGTEEVLEQGGRIAVISFHSLEDRITKQFIRAGHWKSITSQVITAGEEERMRNRRSRSAKLRVAEKI